MLMRKLGHVAGGALISLSILAGVATVSHATTLKITVTNLAAPGGFALTPLYTAFHNSSFDAFNVGSAASPGLELLAELGNPSAIAAERTGIQPGSVGGVIAADANGVPPIEAGETASRTFDVNAMDHTFFTFLSMILPSNDTFIGSDDAIRLFDDTGNYLGDQTINVTGSYIYDAGTEVNDASATGGAAPFAGAPGGAVEGGLITPGQSLTDFAGLALFGQTLDSNLIDFVNDPANFQVARIEISAVPLPAALPLFGAALIGIGFLSRRRKNAEAKVEA